MVDNIPTVAFLPPAEVSECFVLHFISNLPERQASGTVLRLPARKLY